MSTISFPPGSIIKRPVEGATGKLIFHTGIYINNDRVIHFCGDSSLDPAATIKAESLENFAKPMPTDIIKLHAAPKSVEHAIRICNAAEKHLANPDGWNECYNLRTRNCEDFCKTCYETSSFTKPRINAPVTQVRKFLTTLLASFIAILSLLLKSKPATKQQRTFNIFGRKNK